MNSLLKKLLCLNLALLICLFSVFISFGETSFNISSGVFGDSSGGSSGGGGGSSPGGGSAVASPYKITVDGTTFDSNQSTSGDGWSYAKGNLTLDGYNGGGIYASGGYLNIYSYGNVSISGSSIDNNGNAGIEASSFINIYVYGDSFTVSGGSGSVSGGNAIVTPREFYLYSETSTIINGGDSSDGLGGDGINASYCSIYSFGSLSVCGGAGASIGGNAIVALQEVYVGSEGTSTINGGYSTVGTGGNGIYVPSGRTFLYGTEVSVNGGNASTDACDCYGGYGVYSKHIDIGADCIINGGSAYHGNNAVCAQKSLYLGYKFITLSSGISEGLNRENAIAFYGDNAENMQYEYDTEHCIQSGTYYSLSFQPKQYTITLNGNCGIRGSESTLSYTDYYPTKYFLRGYTFHRSGYYQVAWAGVSDNPNEIFDYLYPLDTVVKPTQDTSFVAVWKTAEKGDVLLVRPSGSRITINASTTDLSSIDLSNICVRYDSPSSVILPDSFTIFNQTFGSTRIDWWQTDPNYSTDKRGIFRSACYSSDDLFYPEKHIPNVLYPFRFSIEGCSYIKYHAYRCKSSYWGDVVIQECNVSGTNLAVLNATENDFVTPDGRKLIGWSTTAGGEKKYDLKSTIPMNNNEVLDLYPVWGVADNAVIANGTFTIPDAPEIENYTFIGWYEVSDDNDLSWVPKTDRVWHMPGDVDYFSKETVLVPEYYYVSGVSDFIFIDGQGGTMQNGSKYYVCYVSSASLASYTLPNDLFSNGNIGFINYNYNIDGTGNSANPGDGITDDGHVHKLYAQWNNVSTLSPEEGVTVRNNANTGVLTVKMTKTWCEAQGLSNVVVALFNGDYCIVSKKEVFNNTAINMSFELDGINNPKVRMFVLDANYKPIRDSVIAQL